MTTNLNLPRAAFFDIDGTLVGASGTLSERSIRAIHKLEDAGVKCGFATGRPWFAAKEFAQQLRMTGPSVCFSGGAILDSQSGATLDAEYLDSMKTEKLVQQLLEAGIYFELYSDTDWFAEHEEHPFLIFHGDILRSRPKMAKLTELAVSMEVVKITGVIDSEEEATLIQRILIGYPEFTVTFSFGPGRRDLSFFSITSQRASRENALKKVCALLDTVPEEIFAAGDSDGDKHFIQTCKYGIAMANAPLDVRQSASLVVATVDEDGLAEGIESLFPGLFAP